MPDTQTLALLLGASQFPNAPLLGSGEAFENSAQSFKRYLLSPRGLDLDPADLLDLFDDSRPAGELLDLIISFLDKRQSKKSSTSVERLLVYYVGHGGFTNVGNEYFLAVRSTRERSEGHSSIRINDLGQIIRDKARFICQYLILDCCFSAQAYKAFQSGPGDAAVSRTLESVPRKGTALLCSSGPSEVSLVPEDNRYTMFSGALLDALNTGDSSFSEFLSLADTGSLIEQRLRDNYANTRVRPQIHCPSQPEGDLTVLPLFPNPKHPTHLGMSVRSGPHKASPFTAIPAEINSVLANPLPNFRVTAIRELLGLVRSGVPAALKDLIQRELQIVSEQDDSILVRQTATETLTEALSLAAVSYDEILDPNYRRLQENENRIAAEIQQRLMSTDTEGLSYASFETSFKIYSEVSGDFVDTIQTPNSFAIVLADMSGKGIGSALVASLLQGFFYSELSRDVPLVTACELANDAMLRKTGGQKYTVVTLVRLSTSGTVEIVNAGGVHPILVSGGQAISIEASGLPLGLFPNATYEVTVLKMAPGDRLLLSTDGFVEIEDASGELFGEERMKNFALEGFSALTKAIDNFSNNTPIKDEAILVQLSYIGSPDNLSTTDLSKLESHSTASELMSELLTVKLRIFCDDKRGMLKNFTEIIISDDRTNIRRFETAPVGNGKVIVDFVIELTDLRRLHLMVEQLKKVPGVEEVQETKPI